MTWWICLLTGFALFMFAGFLEQHRPSVAGGAGMPVAILAIAVFMAGIFIGLFQLVLP